MATSFSYRSSRILPPGRALGFVGSRASRIDGRGRPETITSGSERALLDKNGAVEIRSDPKREAARCCNSYICRYLFSLRMTIRSEEHTSELQSLMRISYAV